MTDLSVFLPAPYALLTEDEAKDVLLLQGSEKPYRLLGAEMIGGQPRYRAVPCAEVGPALVLDHILNGHPSLLVGADQAARYADDWEMAGMGAAVLPIPVGGAFVLKHVTPWVDTEHFLAFSAWNKQRLSAAFEEARRHPIGLA